MPLRNDLLNPVSSDKPSGENLRFAPVFDKIKEARRQDDDLAQGEWVRERKVADWPLTIKLISETLVTKSKDLQLVAWLAEAMLRREGITGFREVLDLGRSMVETFWDSLYPELEDGDAELRAMPLQWIGDRLEFPIKQVALTKKGLNWYQYKESRAIGDEKSVAGNNDKKKEREAAIKAGKTPQEVFDKDFDETPKKFYVDLLASFDSTLDSLTELQDLGDSKFGGNSPTYGTLRKALEEVRQTVYILLQKKREKEPDAPAAPPRLHRKRSPPHRLRPRRQQLLLLLPRQRPRRRPLQFQRRRPRLLRQRLLLPPSPRQAFPLSLPTVTTPLNAFSQSPNIFAMPRKPAPPRIS